jgi:hypothetical protein
MYSTRCPGDMSMEAQIRRAEAILSSTCLIRIQYWSAWLERKSAASTYCTQAREDIKWDIVRNARPEEVWDSAWRHLYGGFVRYDPSHHIHTVKHDVPPQVEIRMRTGDCAGDTHRTRQHILYADERTLLLAPARHSRTPTVCFLVPTDKQQAVFRLRGLLT